MMNHQELINYFERIGLTSEQYWIGPEHPRLERFALNLLTERSGKQVLEIGFQAGGFAVPIIEAMQSETGFAYTGVDDGRYVNAVTGPTLTDYLIGRDTVAEVFRFIDSDARDYLLSCDRQFDLILLDHAKPLYPRELRLLLSRNIISPGGVILLHDIEDKASGVWPDCLTLVERFGCTTSLHPEIPAGLAVVYCPEKGLLPARMADRLFTARLKAKRFIKGRRQ